jgi:uncharacterized protein YbaP (TraB family)
MQGRFVLRLLTAVATLWLSVPAWSDGDTHHILWEVKGRHNTIYLLGSVHLLRPDDSAIPAEALRAYAQSKTLVMELDLSATGSVDALAEGEELGMLPEGRTLEGALGAELYAKFKSHAAAVGLDSELSSRLQPWFAALMLEQFELAKAGFDASSGVDMQFAQRAQADEKPIIGLETMDEQLRIFASLSEQQQRDYMRSTLDEVDSEADETEQLVHAWQHGDTAKLEQLLREATHDSPELFRKLTVDRNRRWLPKITQMLNDDSNYLIVVGALHLIGHDGLVDLLQHNGYTLIQH